MNYTIINLLTPYEYVSNKNGKYTTVYQESSYLTKQ